MSHAGHTSWTLPPDDPHGFEDNVRRLTESLRADERISHISEAPLPDHAVVEKITRRLIWLMYPGFYGPRDLSAESLPAHVRTVLGQIVERLLEQITAALRYGEHLHHRGTRAADTSECEQRAARAAAQFLERLPTIREWLSLDVQAAFDGDPAAIHTDEIIFCYPGLHALTVHRLAHELYRLDVPLIPRIMHESAHRETGIDIHPGARIGKSFFIDHGTGVVIGETTVIGDHCKLYQGVTLGAKSFPKDQRGRLMRGEKRHPTLEDHVTVYAGATILGGDTIIGAGSVINGGVFLTNSVPPGHVVRAPRTELKMRSNPELPPPSYDI